MGDAVIVLATNAHRESFDERLKEDGLVVAVAYERGQYISMDAAATLPEIMVEGVPDARRFTEVVGSLITRTHSFSLFCGYPNRWRDEFVRMAGAPSRSWLVNVIRTAGYFSRNWPAQPLNVWGGEAVHAEGVGDLAAVMDVVLEDVPDDPSAGVGVDLAFPLILDGRLQICERIAS